MINDMVRYKLEVLQTSAEENTAMNFFYVLAHILHSSNPTTVNNTAIHNKSENHLYAFKPLDSAPKPKILHTGMSLDGYHNQHTSLSLRMAIGQWPPIVNC